QVVDVQRMVVGLPVAAHPEFSSLDEPEENTEPLRIAGSIYGRGAKDHGLQPLADILLDHFLAVVFRELIVIFRCYGALFVAGWVADVSVNTARTAVHQAPHTEPVAGIGDVRRPSSVDVAVI